jgi:ABC-type dipeptide/oligopeptide/nickel transport system permease subunit
MATAQSSTQVLRFPALPTRRLWKHVTVKRALAGHTLYRLGVLITLFWVAVALLAPWIAPYSPTQGDAALAKGSPSLSHPFGLDK